jgi:hypothetical protein
MNHLANSINFQYSLPVLSGLIAVLSLAFFPLSQGSALADLPEIIVPLGVSAGLALYSVRLLEHDYDVDQIKRIAIYGWIGAFAGSVGIVILSQELQRQLVTALLLDEALTIVSLGSAAGVVLGTRAIHDHGSVDRSDRDRVVAETVWTTEPAPTPILGAVTTQLAELEGVDPLELDPLYEDIDPDVFAQLRTHDDSQWQILFYTDDYEIRVSGQGTVTVYDIDSPAEKTPQISAPRGEW